MTNIRRYYIPNAIYFITCVTYQRKDLFSAPENISLFREIFKNIKRIYSHKLYAHVLIYDHFHFLIMPKQGNISALMKSLKDNFSRQYKNMWSFKNNIRIWQHRFWDHIIRNEEDFRRHFDYIHYNPVKHRIVSKPEDFNQSSFNFWLKKGVYQIGWGYTFENELEKMNFE